QMRQIITPEEVNGKVLATKKIIEKKLCSQERISPEWDKERNNGQNKLIEDKCFRCGGKGHWSRNCCTPRHLVDLYQASLKNDDKRKETNFVSNDAENYTTHYEVSDFFEDAEGNIGHLINDGIVLYVGLLSTH
ncbi:hypothetical protein S245_028752, partial [Arachis hypogaea]